MENDFWNTIIISKDEERLYEYYSCRELENTLLSNLKIKQMKQLLTTVATLLPFMGFSQTKPFKSPSTINTPLYEITNTYTVKDIYGNVGAKIDSWNTGKIDVYTSKNGYLNNKISIEPVRVNKYEPKLNNVKPILTLEDMKNTSSVNPFEGFFKTKSR